MGTPDSDVTFSRAMFGNVLFLKWDSSEDTISYARREIFGRPLSRSSYASKKVEASRGTILFGCLNGYGGSFRRTSNGSHIIICVGYRDISRKLFAAYTISLAVRSLWSMSRLNELKSCAVTTMSSFLPSLLHIVTYAYVSTMFTSFLS